MTEDGDPLTKYLRLEEDEAEFLRGLVMRAYKTVRTGPPRDLATDDATGTLPRDELRVVAFAFALEEPTQNVVESDGAGVGREPPYTRVRFNDGDRAMQFCAAAQEVVREWEHKFGNPHFVLANEFALSFRSTAREDLLRRWSEMAQHHKAYIVPGTFHSKDELANVAPIIDPSGKRASRYIYKQNCAAKMGESIRTPDVRTFTQIETGYGNLGVWICLDLYDPGLVLKLLVQAYRLSPSRQADQPGREPQVLLIPSYSSEDTKKLKDAVKRVSHFSNTLTIVSNAFHAGEGADRSNKRKCVLDIVGYLCGDELTPVEEKALGPGGKLGRAVLFSVPSRRIEEAQAKRFAERFSTAFQSILTGEPTIERVPP